VRSNLQQLIAMKAAREKRRITARTVTLETKLNKHTIYGLVNNTMKEYPAEVLATLCVYLPCSVGELLVLEDMPDAT
jgi:DNA-binding Xre family transcriptional regulator